MYLALLTAQSKRSKNANWQEVDQLPLYFFALHCSAGQTIQQYSRLGFKISCLEAENNVEEFKTEI